MGQPAVIYYRFFVTAMSSCSTFVLVCMLSSLECNAADGSRITLTDDGLPGLTLSNERQISLPFRHSHDAINTGLQFTYYGLTKAPELKLRLDSFSLDASLSGRNITPKLRLRSQDGMQEYGAMVDFNTPRLFMKIRF